MLIDDFRRRWLFVHQMTLEFAAAVPDALAR